ncbi:hypothetical protein HD554DRAFT_2024527, partial [Boletus coccyginus]
NCLVAVQPNTTKADLPSTHNISTFIHNEFVEFIKHLKAEIQVHHTIFYFLFSANLYTHLPTVAIQWSHLHHHGPLVHQVNKDSILKHHGSLDSSQHQHQKVVPTSSSRPLLGILRCIQW